MWFRILSGHVASTHSTFYQIYRTIISEKRSLSSYISINIYTYVY